MDNSSTNQPKTSVLLLFVLIAALARLLFLEMPNVAPIGAMALFGGAYFANRKLSFAFPLLAMLASDFVLQILYWTGNSTFAGFHPSMIWVYVAIVAVILIGRLLHNRVNVLTTAAGWLGAAVAFYLITNFGVWISGTVGYPMTFSGLIICYTEAIPFFRNTLVGDLVFVTALFGSYEALKYRFPQLALVKA